MPTGHCCRGQRAIRAEPPPASLASNAEGSKGQQGPFPTHGWGWLCVAKAFP